MHRFDQLVDVFLEEILGSGRREGPGGLVGHPRNADVHVVAYVHVDGGLHRAGDRQAQRGRDGALESGLCGTYPQVLYAASRTAHAAHRAHVAHADGGGAVAGHGHVAAVAGQGQRVYQTRDGVGVVRGALVLGRRHHAAHLLS